MKLLPGRTYQVGANVRITRGSLAGVTGVVIETTGHSCNCVMSVDFWAHGIRLALNGDDLEQIEMNRPRL
jgi:transcription antitermination factor NusG